MRPNWNRSWTSKNSELGKLMRPLRKSAREILRQLRRPRKDQRK